MILETVLNNLQWTPYGIQCPDANTAKIVHKFMREAVLDRHIYLSKVIGFSINTNNTFRAYTGNYIARHKQIGESYPEIMVNMQDKIFVNVSETVLDSTLQTGVNTVETSPFWRAYNDFVETLYANPNICRCLTKETNFKVKLEYDCGYRSMTANSKNLSSEYFPCNTDYTMHQFVRILPMDVGSTLVPIRYYNGLTEETFKSILRKWLIYIQTNSLKKEESLWLQSFMH